MPVAVSLLLLVVAAVAVRAAAGGGGGKMASSHGHGEVSPRDIHLYYSIVDLL
jgi:hypothetical protein